jgi:hypothetical protein
MMMRRAILGAGLAGVLVLASCQASESSSSRYKLAVEVETPEGVRTAHSVIAVQFSRTMKGFEALGGGGVRARGEAVALDLPNDQTLFVLLRSATNADWAGQAHWRRYPKSPHEFETTSKFYEAMMNDKTVYPVPREVKWTGGEMMDNYPYFVTFKDIGDPISVERVDPDNLAASFGAGYRLKGLTVQVTDEPVTVGIKNRLAWLSDYPEPSLKFNHGPKDFSLSAKLQHRDFSRGSTK